MQRLCGDRHHGTRDKPFYPSPNRDDGYDLVDFYGVDERVGTLGDVVELIRTARDRGIRVSADFVVNHTSDQHPWFRSAWAFNEQAGQFYLHRFYFHQPGLNPTSPGFSSGFSSCQT